MELIEYSGPIKGYHTPFLVRKALSAWEGQRTRCTNTRSEKFPTYGARGIRVEYTKRAFISWYLANYPSGMDRPTIGRIDHDDHYRFGNIRFEPLRENSRERMLRAPNPSLAKRREILIREKNTGEVVAIVETTRDAAAVTGVSKSGVHYQLSTRRRPKKKQLPYTFSYMDKVS